MIAVVVSALQTRQEIPAGCGGIVEFVGGESAKGDQEAAPGCQLRRGRGQAVVQFLASGVQLQRQSRALGMDLEEGFEQNGRFGFWQRH
jgi:hypothetical protein